MPKFKIDEQIVITNYTPNTLNGLTGTIREFGLDDTYYIEVCHDSIHYLFLTDDEISIKTVNSTFNIGDEVIVTKDNSCYYNLIGKVTGTRFKLDDSTFQYYIKFREDDCSYLFLDNELKIFNISHFCSQTTIDILS
jgi:hypothetical protein